MRVMSMNTRVESVKLPAGKLVLPGVITHSTDVIEHPGWWRNASSASPRSSAKRTLPPAPIAALAAAPIHKSVRELKASDGAAIATKDLKYA